jgi:indole-3-glycerol phosphate synthase
MLQDLFAGAVADAHARSQLTTISELYNRAEKRSPALDVCKLFSSSENVSVIAEIKRASPSKGKLAEIPNAAELAGIYEASGASAISVLTEQRKFLGSLEDFSLVRNRVNLPLLRKDFIANEYQVVEARAYGADLVLLIAAGLNQPQLAHLYKLVSDLGMTALVETHSKEEIARALDIGAKIIGVNVRNLSTFETDRALFAGLSENIPANVIKVAESAVRNVDDVREYAEQGAEAVLVGEALVTGDAEALLRTFSSIPKTRI